MRRLLIDHESARGQLDGPLGDTTDCLGELMFGFLIHRNWGRVIQQDDGGTLVGVEVWGCSRGSINDIHLSSGGSDWGGRCPLKCCLVFHVGTPKPPLQPTL